MGQLDSVADSFCRMAGGRNDESEILNDASSSAPNNREPDTIVDRTVVSPGILERPLDLTTGKTPEPLRPRNNDFCLIL